MYTEITEKLHINLDRHVVKATLLGWGEYDWHFPLYSRIESRLYVIFRQSYKSCTSVLSAGISKRLRKEGV